MFGKARRYRDWFLLDLMSRIEQRNTDLITVLAYYKEATINDWEFWVKRINSEPSYNQLVKVHSRWPSYNDLRYAVWYSRRDIFIERLDYTIAVVIKKYNKGAFRYNKKELIDFLDEYNDWLVDYLSIEGREESSIPLEMISAKLKELVVKYKDTTTIV